MEDVDTHIFRSMTMWMVIEHIDDVEERGLWFATLMTIYCLPEAPETVFNDAE